MINKLMRSHEDATIERFQNDPALATEYLAAIVTDGDENELRHARRLIAKYLSLERIISRHEQ